MLFSRIHRHVLSASVGRLTSAHPRAIGGTRLSRAGERLPRPFLDTSRVPPTLAQRLLDGDRRALARAITLVEDDRPEGWELVREVYPHTGKAAVYGFTGPPGVGKSTLIGALTKTRREAGRSVGVLSIDPSSPFTQGALLGDRIRLTEHFLDQGVFIRSMANRGALGGLSEAALQAALLLDAAGREDVFVETVGVGQAEIDIIDHADTIVLVLMPGSGDSIQALKAGVMEIPDVIVINKADHPLTDTMVREIRGVLSLANVNGDATDPSGAHPGGGGSKWRVPIVKTEAAHGKGISELVERLDAHRAHILGEGTLQERRGRNLRNEVLAIATARMRRRLEEELREDAAFARLLEEVVERRLDPASAATALLEQHRA
jgi:GTPase